MPRNGTPSWVTSVVPLLAHLLLLGFSWLLILKLDDKTALSWWVVFSPLWLFHALLSRCVCSMPAPNSANDHQWNPCHTLVVLPLLLSFEVLLCCYLEALHGRSHTPPMSIAVVFVPLILLELIVLFDNFRMCVILMPGEDEDMTDEALWETLPHFAIAVSMVFFLAATIFTVLKLSAVDDDISDNIDWWTLLVDLCIGEFFGFLLCIKWTNPHAPAIRPPLPPPSHYFPSPPLQPSISPLPSSSPSSSTLSTPLLSDQQPTATSATFSTGEGSGIHSEELIESLPPSTSAPAGSVSSNQTPEQVLSSTPAGEAAAATEAAATAARNNEGVAAAVAAAAGTTAGNTAPSESGDSEIEFACGAPEVGGHLMKAGLVVFQILVCMRLEGQPEWAAKMSIFSLFSPLLLVQLAAVLSASAQLLEGLLLRYSSAIGAVFSAAVREYDPFMFVTRGMRLAGWWWKDDEVKEERRTITSGILPEYIPCEATPPDHIRKMRKADLAEEVVRLQSALIDTVEQSKSQKQELDRVQQEKILCRVCFERDISLVLLPCRHRVLCHICSDRCKQCPICRSLIIERMTVYDV